MDGDGVLSIAFYVILVVLLVLLNGFFVASEFALTRVRQTQIAQLKEKRAGIAEKILSNRDSYLSATQLGITLASLSLGWIGEPTIAKMIKPFLSTIGLPMWSIHAAAFIIAFAILTLLHIVLGEMTPKSLAIHHAERIILWTSGPLYAFHRLFKPFIAMLNGSADKIRSWVGVDSEDDRQAHTEEDIRMVMAQSHRNGVIDQTEFTLFDNVFQFADRMGREIMVPRVNMVCLYKDQTLKENWAIMQSSNHTRFPLCDKDKDDIIGIVHIRDVYEALLLEKTISLEKIARPEVLVPETMELTKILRNLQKSKAGMAIVVDEYGGTAGLVTTEDIIEEIFGDIQDEFDDEPPPLQTGEEGILLDPRLLIEEVNEHLRTAIEDPGNDTIGGWFFSRLGKVPEIGDQVRSDGWLFTVAEAHERWITRLLVKPIADHPKKILLHVNSAS
ncbi:hemolysin family protein [Paludifilum halophilum]|uniref:Transporter associated domain protein n=1 Tax=Paludifilum halophilum TaxID=1642702 RepID=A0A235B5D4_9BACL|nr:hemolysin family protein [Paludifilum halophilum]OYD07504.1 hypothetical protein CHM34_11455 [Paludifilum halophilum]